MSYSAPNRSVPRQAFTLVELLVAVAIISILMAIAIPAIVGALRKGRESAIRTEVEALSQSIEAYKLKYGDYPPDFFDWSLVVRHYRKIFPNIDPLEIAVLRDQCALQSAVDSNVANPAHDPFRIDRAEALVWALSGFSSDPQRPFTGPNGPLTAKVIPIVTTRPSHYKNFSYNGTRDNALFDFEASLLTVGEYNSATATLSVLAVDESTNPANHDLFPIYLRQKDASPYVYFDSRTYGAVVVSTTLANVYDSPTDRWGRVRPYLSAQLVSPTESVVRTAAAAGSPGLDFMNPNAFQIISAGLDDMLGVATGIPHDPSAANAGNAIYFSYPDGGIWQVDTSTALPTGETRVLVNSVGSKYQDIGLSGVTDTEVRHLDNFTNFAQSTLESDLP